MITPLCSALLLSACGSNEDPAWQAYHQTLESALDAEPIAREAPSNIGAFPDRRERLLDVPDIRESMFNVYALRECDITSLVAARNNQLGRVAPPSQHWLYERELWRRLERCSQSDVVEGLGENDRARLLNLTALKTEQLPAVGFNALFDSEEWEKNFSRASQPLELTALPDMTRELEALGYLETMVLNTYDLEWQADSATLEQHLKALQARPLTAEVLRTLLLGAERLNEANRLLASHLPATQCLPAWQSDWLANMARAARRWLGQVNALIDAHEVNAPAAVAEYQRQWLSLETASAPWPRFEAALMEHLALRTAYPVCTRNQGVD
ncbi:DUF3080 domain-containing protein [Halomonas sp. GD1P12]|uniref:DUF3080 domain-containing protein n=1 Tax=Halomonas sp. GD1P12 TaxID=2982691 RepID=UPI0021E506F6|nr:DUF3080 domain-containing protein [Halomonas sp. GD1P12]UYG01130.1 DUF3080 domain-containing protein [Halomonas sp. GD1P12]